MLIRNNSARVIHIPAGLGAEHSDVQLRPGANDVPDEAWEAAQQIRVVQFLARKQEGQERPDLEVIGASDAKGETVHAASVDMPPPALGTPSTTVAPAAPAAPPAPADLSEMNATDAIALINQTTDRAALGRWAEEDDRKTVQDAIAHRLDVLGGA